jgi:hypothetical protein
MVFVDPAVSVSKKQRKILEKQFVSHLHVCDERGGLDGRLDGGFDGGLTEALRVVAEATT